MQYLRMSDLAQGFSFLSEEMTARNLLYGTDVRAEQPFQSSEFLRIADDVLSSSDHECWAPDNGFGLFDMSGNVGIGGSEIGTI